MKTTLITGGLGFIGSNICDLLLQKKYTNKCILLDNFGGYMNPIKPKPPVIKVVFISYYPCKIDL